MDEFYYNIEQIVTATLDIKDPNYCAIEAYNDREEYYYLIIRTDLGNTQIFEYGPIVPDIDLLPKRVECTFERIEFKEYTVFRKIENFLKNYKRNIKKAQEISIEEALNRCKSLVDYMKEYDPQHKY